MQSSHFYLFKAFTNCFHTLIWRGRSNTSFGLIKRRCIIFLLPISNPLWPIFPSPMLLTSPAVPQAQETRKVCASTLLPNQYAQILLIYCKSSSHAHQLWYQAQTILTFDCSCRLSTGYHNSLPVGLRSSTTADKAFQYLKAQLVSTKCF